MIGAPPAVSPENVEAFARDGVVHLPGALDGRAIALVEAAFDWKLANPGPGAASLYGESGARFFQAKGESSHAPAFAALLADRPIGDIVAALFGGGPVWYLEEQLFLKEGGPGDTRARRTPWHQDVSYEPMSGERSAVVWIPLDPVPRDCALEVVRGSHRGPIYGASRFDPADDTAPFAGHEALPRLPDIEEARGAFDIVGWACAPGDLLIFHGTALHGGGGTRPGGRRRSLTLRFVGDDAVKIALAGAAGGPPDHANPFAALPVGAPVSEACRMRVRG